MPNLSIKSEGYGVGETTVCTNPGGNYRFKLKVIHAMFTQTTTPKATKMKFLRMCYWCDWQSGEKEEGTEEKSEK